MDNNRPTPPPSWTTVFIAVAVMLAAVIAGGWLCIHAALAVGS